MNPDPVHQKSTQPAAKIGTLWGIGLGPGDPQLLTLKAVKAIGLVDVIAYSAPDAADAPPSLARTIAAEWLTRGVPEYALRLPMVEPRHPAAAIYDRAAEDLAQYLQQGQSVGFLCQGDPLFYGSFIYVMNRLVERFPLEIIPGVSSLTAAAAAARFPLTGRTDRLSVVPATLGDDQIAQSLARDDAVVLIKLGKNLARIKALLERQGLMDRAIYVERATMSEQRIMPLVQVAGDRAPYFALILVRRMAVE
ncbi:MAG: precorrin-2 C(20)-methyltransferase [Candidatus Pacebacteria bacterium]|nr:precorrin-2 C(20)-methyltransferase [Candidatus Paceibacterota bacterium]